VTCSTDTTFRNIEITDVNDVDEYLKHEPMGAEGGASSAAATITHNKPAARGRKGGKSRVKKFVADDDE